MFKWLKKLTAIDPRKAKLVEALSWCDEIMGDELMWQHIRDRILTSIRLTKLEKGELQLLSDANAAGFTLTLIYNVTGKRVTSGDYHIYRGTLSMRGKSLRNLAELALSELNENGHINDEEYHNALDELAQGIREAG